MMPLNEIDIETLLPLLTSEDVAQRQQAAIALSRVQDARVIVPLMAALDDEDSTVRANAAAGLGENKATESIAALIERLRQDEHDIVRERAAAALAQIGDERAIEPLIDALDDPATWTRNRVIYVLGASGDQRAVDPLIELLDHADLTTQGNAAWALGAIGDVRALNPLIGLLKSKNATVRGNAAWALGELAQPQAIAPLFPLLQDKSPEVRSKAAWAMGSLGELTGETRMVPALLRMLDDHAEIKNGPTTHVIVSQYAAEALMQIGTDEAKAAVEHWRPLAAEQLRPRRIQQLISVLSQTDPDTITAAVEQLVEMGPPTLEPLMEALKSKNVRIRQNAARALGDLHLPQAGPALMIALADTDIGVWSQATAALAKLGKSVVPLLQPALNSSKRLVKMGASLALWRIQREERAFQTLLTALHDEDFVVRGSAIVSLWQQPDERAIATLQIRLQEEEGMMARYVLQALQTIGTPAAQATIAHWMAENQL
ncbi:HEAT repeat domain-containing protein [Phototrophicus methaneseepsis]|uniref:HEAT repeat domain-containing protein n=1 Tax=Phototrophicus methaneseepsis TaxID=2710758 RepID=A0A7S8IDD8_9CHLR|nr:HEAT repeat domain-containing protein [Phototrophicus methaneseepsis]QPC82485.1 HEAT repeat domain-containing protein [Phototrophicus methaneseepsis]